MAHLIGSAWLGQRPSAAVSPTACARSHPQPTPHPTAKMIWSQRALRTSKQQGPDMCTRGSVHQGIRSAAGNTRGAAVTRPWNSG